MTTLPATASEKNRAYGWDAAARVLSFAGTRKGSSASYLVDELECDGGRGFQLTKVEGGSDPEEAGYACFLANTGYDSCDCKGFTRWGKCKHLDCVRDMVSNNTI
jgi:hypothetical protein